MGDDSEVTSMNVEMTREVAGMITSTTDFLQEKYNGLVKEMVSTSGCAGNDAGGKQFYQQYLPNAEKFTSMVSQFVRQLQQNATSIRKLPAQFEEADEENAKGVNGSS